ncbi:hypothetical protein AMS68_004875 [Peltaster fructicola]|uniref:Phospholipid/glycerol acyltransferase domain-containing protein n=1 Tax=Peltaster fructicola TaxID=286661 RepID=A0A6H0XXN3_9PEZI|nr:hypothetical protein AMS68_004875 [Peltaster fructicola]
MSKRKNTAAQTAPDIAIQGDNLTLHPPTYIGAQSGVGERELLEPYARFRVKPLDAFQELGQHISGTGWRSYERPIGQPMFYKGFTENMSSKVMKQERLRRKVAELALKRVEVEMQEGSLGPLGLAGEAEIYKKRRMERQAQLEAQLLTVAEKSVDNMITKLENRTFIRGAYYLATQLLLRAYHQGIHVNSEEVVNLRKVASEAAKKKQSIVFLPSHRSHIDYISLQIVCYRLGLALPTVVAGDNLNFPLVGPFLQHAGAMWIRRSFGNDKLYSTVVQAYMDTLLQNGFNFECFIEGGRSRTGKLLQPKFGILSFILESVMSGSVDDCIICPVSTQYDKVIEVDSYISELLGMPKQKEDLMQFLSATDVLSWKLGRVDVRFHEPWSLRQFVTDQTTRITQQPSSPDAVNEKAIRRKILTTLGFRVLSEINDVSVVMPTALVGTVLLTLRGRGVGRAELVRRVEWLAERVQGQGGRLAHFGLQDTDFVVQRALEVLGPKLVGTVKDLPEETYFAVDRFQLSFYRNMTIHLFISQALVCAALYTKVKAGGAAHTQTLTWQELYDHVLFLSQLFRTEFIFPTASLEENIKTTLAGLEEDHVVQTIKEGEKITAIELHPNERANGRENFDFYNFLLWPFIEANWLGAVSMFMLTPPPVATTTPAVADTKTWIDQKKFENGAQLLGKTLYHQGDLSYFEAVNKEALKNAFARAEEEGIILVSRNKETKAPPMVRLGAEWLPPRNTEGKAVPDGKLWEFAERISQFRREGKNRRDGATVKTRVLNLVDMVAAGLVTDVTMDVQGKPSKSSRRKGMQTKAVTAKL